MEERLNQLKEFLKTSPEDPFLKYAIATEYLKRGDKERTREIFEDLVTNHTDYVGTYYHYAKLLEEYGEKENALKVYQNGMEIAKRLRNMHAHGELQRAYQLAQGLDEDDDF